jgi:hypothetical protein
MTRDFAPNYPAPVWDALDLLESARDPIPEDLKAALDLIIATARGPFVIVIAD